MSLLIATISGPVRLIVYANSGATRRINGAYTAIREADEGEAGMSGHGDTVQEAIDSLMALGL